jgi:hypothetical protein
MRLPFLRRASSRCESLALPRWGIPIVLLLLTLACNFPGLPGDRATETPETTAFTIVSPTVTPTAGTAEAMTPSASPTPEPTESLETVDEARGCTLKAAFLEDVTIPDDSVVPPGEPFTKTWRIENSGTCSWTEGTTLAFLSGDDLSPDDAVSVPSTEPSGALELSVEMEAPAEGGTYRSNWQLQTPEGERYGGVFYAQIRVPSPTPTPSPTVETFSGPARFLGAVNSTCSAVDFTWEDATGEDAYRIEGPDLDVNLPANAESYRWSSPPTGLSQVTLTATGDDDERAQVEATVNVVCDGSQPDLTFASVTLSPTTVSAYLPYDVIVEIENAGDADSGGFVLTWRNRKTADRPTCEWLISEGLAEGETRTVTCTPPPFQGPFAALVTQAEIDATDVIIEADEENNLVEEEIAVEAPATAYDLIENAPDAIWSAGPPSEQLIWPGETGDSQGYARLATGSIENGQPLSAPCLEMRPKLAEGGWIQGHFAELADGDYTVAEGDHFRASLALLESGIEGRVTYRAILKIVDGESVTLFKEAHAYGEGLESLLIDLRPYAGETVSVILAVDAGSSPSDDRACWVEASIYQYPGEE